MDGDRHNPYNSDETDQIQGNSAHAQMEVSLSSIAFKGSVSQAIVAAKTWRKILLVYIGDPGENSVHLEQSTFRDSEVVKLLSEYCVVLHLLEGSIDVVHFSAFCPHKSAPALSAIGYNGNLLWQYEGYISANDFVASIEKARADLHSQEVVSNLVSSEHEGNLNTAEPYPPGEIHSQQSSISQTMSEPTWGTEETVQTVVSSRDDGQEDMAHTSIISASATPSRPTNASSSKCDSIANSTESSTSLVENSTNLAFSDKKITDPTCVLVQTKESTDASLSNLAGNNSQRGIRVSPSDTNIGGEMLRADNELFREQTINIASLGLEHPTTEIFPEGETGDQGTTHVVADINNNKGEMLEADDQLLKEQTSNVASLGTEQPTIEIAPNGEMGDQGSSHVMDDQSARRLPSRDSSSIYLQIRLLNGSSLQAKFQAADTLRRVKDYVNENRTDGNKTFSLAIPYPRKIFGEEDMGKVLSELNLGTRVAMILVPFESARSPVWRSSSQANNMGSPSSLQNREAGPGLFARILSYFNPFSYFSGTSTNQDSMSRDSVWQYGPNPSLQSTFKDGSQNSSYMSRSNTPGKDQKPSGSSKVEKKGWGSNIHTLNHDEDESFRDRNAFWNGNSTQYGGDDNKRD